MYQEIEHSPQTDYKEDAISARINFKGEKEVKKIVPAIPRTPNLITVSVDPQISIKPPNNLPQYPSAPRIANPAVQGLSELKSANARHVTQQSFTPSQKTIVLNHISNQANGVYHSHVSTERMPIPLMREPREGNVRHSHIVENRLQSPTRVSFDYQNKAEGLVVRNALFNSYIPTSTPIIMEKVGAVSSSNAPLPSERHFDQTE